MEFKPTRKKKIQQKPPAQPDEASVTDQESDDPRPKGLLKWLPDSPAALRQYAWQLAKTHKRFVIPAVVTLIGIGAITTTLLVRSFDKPPTRVSAPAGTPDTPSYSTVLPEGKSPDALGGWRRISPPENDPVFAYNDKIGDVAISVSQQPLPASFRSSTDDKIADLAKKFNATTKVEAGRTMAYIGTSAKGPQSTILTKNDLLILIKSEKKISPTAWADYIKQLSPADRGPKY